MIVLFFFIAIISIWGITARIIRNIKSIHRDVSKRQNKQF